MSDEATPMTKFASAQDAEDKARREGFVRHLHAMGKSAAEIEKSVESYNKILEAHAARRNPYAQAIVGG